MSWAERRAGKTSTRPTVRYSPLPFYCIEGLKLTFFFLLCLMVAPCPKCENPKAFFMQLQIRSADEPSKCSTHLYQKNRDRLLTNPGMV